MSMLAAARRARRLHCQEIVEPTAPDQFAAALTAPRTNVDQVIGRADDLFLVFDYEQCIPFIAQVVHHTHEPADIAWV